MKQRQTYLSQSGYTHQMNLDRPGNFGNSASRMSVVACDGAEGLCKSNKEKKCLRSGQTTIGGQGEKDHLFEGSPVINRGNLHPVLAVHQHMKGHWHHGVRVGHTVDRTKKKKKKKKNQPGNKKKTK